MLYLKERSWDLEVEAFRKRKKIKQRLQDLLAICFIIYFMYISYLIVNNIMYSLTD